MEKIFALIVSAGNSSRMGGIDKQLAMFGGKAVLEHTLTTFQRVANLNGIVLIVPSSKLAQMEYLCKKWKIDKTYTVCAGGNSRQESVKNGLLALPLDCDIVLIHDGARPLVSVESINELIKATKSHDLATLAMPVKDTIKKADGDNFVLNTPNRESLWLTQTPQGFRYSLLKKAYQEIKEVSFFTDDASLLEALGFKVKLVKGSYQNIKITTPEDLAIAEVLYKD